MPTLKPSAGAMALCSAALLFGCKSAPEPTPEPTPGPAKTATVAAAPAVDPEPWRANPPPAGPEVEFRLPIPKEVKLKNGLTVLVAEVHGLPLVSYALAFRGGSALDPKGKAGLSSLAFGLLGEGTKKRDALSFTNAITDLGASFGVSANQDRGLLSISGLSTHADAMLGLLAEATLSPRLDAKDFERLKALQLGRLTAQRGTPDGLAFEVIPKMIYGADHPYGHPSGGLSATVKGLGLADVKGVLERTLAPGNAALIVTGDITPEVAQKLAEKHFGAWNKKAAPEIKIASIEPRARTEISFIDLPGAPQTMIALGRPVFGRGHADESAATVVNEVFGGGGIATRLNLNLREKNGYTYGAFSTISARRGVGAFYAMAKVRADATAASLTELMNELERMDVMPPSAEELGRAKDGLVKGIPGQFEHLATMAGVASDLFVYQLPPSYYAELPQRLRAVDEDTAAKLAKTYLAKAVMQIVLVGDAAAHKDAIEALNLGKVVVEKP